MSLGTPRLEDVVSEWIQSKAASEALTQVAMVICFVNFQDDPIQNTSSISRLFQDGGVS